MILLIWMNVDQLSYYLIPTNHAMATMVRMSCGIFFDPNDENVSGPVVIVANWIDIGGADNYKVTTPITINKTVTLAVDCGKIGQIVPTFQSVVM